MWKKLKTILGFGEKPQNFTEKVDDKPQSFSEKVDDKSQNVSEKVDQSNPTIYYDMLVEIIVVVGSTYFKYKNVHQLYKSANPNFSDFENITAIQTDLPETVELKDVEKLLSTIQHSKNYLDRCGTIVQTGKLRFKDPQGDDKELTLVFLTFFGHSIDSPIIISLVPINFSDR